MRVLFIVRILLWNGECILFSTFRFKIRLCNIDMKIKHNKVNALSPDKLLPNIRYKMF